MNTHRREQRRVAPSRVVSNSRRRDGRTSTAFTCQAEPLPGSASSTHSNRSELRSSQPSAAFLASSAAQKGKSNCRGLAVPKFKNVARPPVHSLRTVCGTFTAKAFQAREKGYFGARTQFPKLIGEFRRRDSSLIAGRAIRPSFGGMAALAELLVKLDKTPAAPRCSFAALERAFEAAERAVYTSGSLQNKCGFSPVEKASPSDRRPTPGSSVLEQGVQCLKN